MATKIDESANLRDYMLGLDDIQQPRIVDMSIIKPGEWNAAILFIMRLILMVPGTQEDRPEMGIDIRGRYHFAYEEELMTLNQELMNQIGMYCPELLPVKVNCFMERRDDGNYLAISIVVDEIDYRIMYNVEEKTIVGLEDIM